MSSLDTPDSSAEADERTATVSVDDTELSVIIPADATTDEAAAIATVIGAHLTDQQRVAAANAKEATAFSNPWRLEGKLKSQGHRRIPSGVERGDEWKAAARSLPR
jgi:hypothetical protein